MEKMASARKVGATLLGVMLAFSVLAGFPLNEISHGSSSQIAENQLKRTDTIYISAFLSYTGTLDWNENLWFDINNTGGIPLNTSLPAFDEHFQSADYQMVQYQSWDNYVMMLTVSYDAMDINLAENHTDMLCGEFQRAFNLGVGLRITGSWHEVDNETGYVTVSRQLGSFRMINTIDDLATIEELLKYKPSDGFGQLINENFLKHWLSDPTRGGLIVVQYTVTRFDSQTLSWRFVISIEPSYGRIQESEQSVSVNLNDMLNHSGPIVPLSYAASRIMVHIMKKTITPVGTYSMTFESVSPNYTSFDDTGDPLVTYDLTGPVDNVVATIKIVKENETPDWVNILKFAGIAAVTIASIATVTMVLMRKRRKKDMETSSNRVQCMSCF
jgi:hypothetical protein